MEIVNLKSNETLFKEYIWLCHEEWGSSSVLEKEKFIKEKIKKLQLENYDKLILVLGLVECNQLIGFISLFKTDGEERQDLTPWYSTMYVKKEYRGKGYSKILNDALLDTAKKLGYKKVYLKSNLKNYYEKFKANYIETLQNGESLFYIDLF